jgi:surfactin family lipopeptide synthetase C
LIEDLYDLSAIQSGLYFHLLSEPGSGVYIEQLAFDLRGDLDQAAFRRAWEVLVARHPVLRTSFHWQEVGKALQAVHDRAPVDVPVHDWRGVPDPAHRFTEFVAEQRIRGFDLARPPLMRTELLRLADDRYRFFWTFPHLVLDGWSFGLVFGEFAAAYEALAQGRQPRLPAARPYRDYVAWSRRQDPSRATAYWREQLAGYEPPPPFQVGPAGPREPGQPSHDVLLDPGLRAVVPRLTEAVRAHGLTLNTAMQGAWALLLARYLGVDDVVAGSTSSQRPADLPGAETIVGPMLSTVPVRVRPEPAESLVPWLRQLQESMATGREHGAFSLADLRPLLGLSGGAELFDTDVAFENVPVPELRLHGLEIEDTWYDGRPHYPVTMILVPGEGLTPRVVYQRDRLSAAAAGRLLGHFHTLLDAIAADPGQTLGELPMLPPAERERLMVAGPPTSSASRVLPELFAEHVARAPGAVAVSCGDRSLTYGELDARANRLAHRLRDLGAGPQTRVGLCLARSLDTVVAVVGVLKSGAAYVPLELDSPPARMAAILTDAEASILVTHAAAESRCPEFPGPVVDFDRDAAALEALPDDAPEPLGGPDHLAYIIYTSGSTGRPKGVQVSHANVAALLAGAAQRFSLSDADVWSMVHSYAFDVSVFELWGALAHGGRVVVVPHDTVRSPDDLLALLRQESVSVFSQTPSAFGPFMLAALADGVDRLPLRYVVFAGEYLDVQALRPWLDRYGDEAPNLVNMYGITETTVHSTFATIGKADLDSPVRSRVGRPLPGVGIRLLDRHGEPVPVGVPGEIYVSGPTVSHGYQGAAELTAQRFVTVDGERAYRSGDLARWLEDGELEVLGRLDDQLKVRGFRVEPGEIEAVLRADPAVEAAAVLPRAVGGETQLVAYVVTSPDALDRLRAGLRERLPGYLVPAHLVPLDRLPLTVNGKLDRSALPEPRGQRVEYVPPADPVQEKVAGVWREVLGVDRVGIHDDFFALGGHSLLAARTAFRLRAELGRDVPVRVLFDHPTVAALAEHLPDRPAAPAIRRRERVPYEPEGTGTA